MPGRLNQTSFLADREGVFYGQCSELCWRPDRLVCYETTSEARSASLPSARGWGYALVFHESYRRVNTTLFQLGARITSWYTRRFGPGGAEPLRGERSSPLGVPHCRGELASPLLTGLRPVRGVTPLAQLLSSVPPAAPRCAPRGGGSGAQRGPIRFTSTPNRVASPANAPGCGDGGEAEPYPFPFLRSPYPPPEIGGPQGVVGRLSHTHSHS